MPTYVYRRPDGTTFEAFQRISDDPLTKDPETGVPVQRVISGGVGLQFKGDGFYLTDYARKDSKPASESRTESDGAPKTKADTTKTETASSASAASSDD